MLAGLSLLAGLLVGCAAGYLHFRGLGPTLRLFAEGRLALALGLQLLRVAISVAVLASLIRLGIGALLAGAVGLLLARQWAIRRHGAPT